jgi:hypothetical protein
MQGKAVIGLLAIVFMLAGCEKNITINLDQATPRLVVEASIENGQYPVVSLSNSLDFYGVIDLGILTRSFVHNADVYVSNGTKTHKLIEYIVPIGAGYNYYYYSYDPSDPSTSFRGELKKQYSLRIVSDGKEYTASTTIPDTTRRIDSVFWKNAPAGNPPDLYAVMLRATDRPGFGDYVRYFTKRNSEPFYPGLTSVYDDQVIDGSTYEVQVERGVDRNLPRSEGFSFFHAGDSVTLKLCTIDKATYDFWRTIEFVYVNAGNPFATPTRVLSNISNNGLGYFGGYAAQFRTVVLPH